MTGDFIPEPEFPDADLLAEPSLEDLATENAQPLAAETRESRFITGTKFDPNAPPPPLWIGSDEEKKFKAASYVDLLQTIGFSFRENEITGETEVNSQAIDMTEESVIRSKLRDVGISRLGAARDAYMAAARRNAYHPIRDYLEGLAWDGVDWITTLGAHFADEDDIFPALLRLWLVGAVARVYRPGIQNRLLILDGGQGLGKSWFAAWLCPAQLDRYFQEGAIQPDNKDHLVRLSTAWLWEVSEMGSTTRRADVEALKSFLTMKYVTCRPAYGKYFVQRGALTSFLGTVNNLGGVLNDATGSRRFMTARLLSIDHDYTRLDVNQVWAQAVALYRQGETWQPIGELADEVARINSEMEVPNTVEDYILQYFDVKPGETGYFETTVTILEVLHGAGWRGSGDRGEAMALAAAAKKLGLKTKNSEIDGIRARGWAGLRKLAFDEIQTKKSKITAQMAK